MNGTLSDFFVVNVRILPLKSKAQMMSYFNRSLVEHFLAFILRPFVLSRRKLGDAGSEVCVLFMLPKSVH